jgi:hypothetical protein
MILFGLEALFKMVSMAAVILFGLEALFTKVSMAADLIWFGGPFYKGLQAHSSSFPLPPQILGCDWVLQQSKVKPVSNPLRSSL